MDQEYMYNVQINICQMGVYSTKCDNLHKLYIRKSYIDNHKKGYQYCMCTFVDFACHSYTNIIFWKHF